MKINGGEFKGMLLEARKVGGGTAAVGTFSEASENTKLIKCVNDNDAVTHANRAAKKDFKVTWTPPAGETGDIYFM